MDKLLTLLLFLSLLGFPISLAAARWRKACVLLTLILSAVLLIGSLLLLSRNTPFVAAKTFYTFQGQKTTLAFSIGADGISSWLIFLTCFLLVPCLVLTFTEKNYPTQAALLFLLVFALIGVFSATDLFLFYLFWEISLIPLLFLIGLYGSGQKIYVAKKFFLYTFTGSVFLLAGILFLLFTVQPPTFQWKDLLQWKLSPETQKLLAFLFALGFVVKIPLFPFHTWLPDAHTEAPTTGSVFLAGVLLKMGVYGFVRWIFPLFPEGMIFLSPYLLTLGVVGALYTGIVCYVQPDIKRLVAYSSVAHMGLVVLGFSSLTRYGMEGALLQTFNHGLTTGGLFLLIGMIYDRRHTRRISDFGGLAQVMPHYAAFFLIVALSSAGLPGLNSFPGELLVFLGAFATNKGLTLLGILSVFLSALYLLTAYKNMFHGPITQAENESLNDLTLKEYLVMLPILIAIFLFGFFPPLILSSFQSYLDLLGL